MTGVRADRAARREQGLGGVQVRPDAEVEVCFALPADRGREMEDHVRSGQRASAATANWLTA
jgi:hypothetical protein